MLNDVQAKRCMLFSGLRMVYERRLIQMYKLRIYKLSGADKGNLDHEEFFSTREEMEARYNELFVYENYSLNPTAWKNVDGKWKRLEGF